MLSKIVCLVAFVALATAQHHNTASSYSSINLNHVQHAAPAYHAAPALIQTAHVAPVAYHHAPIATYHSAPVLKAVHHEEYAHPKYSFKYGVEDTHTHDIKSQEETRDGDVVHGSYSLLQPDGIRRIVHYTADKSGFNADVQYDGHASHPEQVHKAVKIVAPVYHHAPVQHY